MGLFDFITDAGEKVLGGKTDKTITDTVEVSADRVNELRGENIKRSLAQLDIEGEQVDVKVNGDKVVLTGSAPSQEAMEKMLLCAGNQHGIAQVDCQLQVDTPVNTTANGATEPVPEAKFYNVEQGDTLGKIAQQFYGAAGKYTVIFEANRPMLSDPDKIYPGQKLRIPPL